MGTKQVSRSKGVRASKPKVRTGCSTCKLRRIKCDETRPNCQRCSRFGRKCGGYERDKPVEEPQPVASAVERTLVPRYVDAGPSTQLFENEKEFSYFQHYCDKTAARFAGAFELPVWGRIFLQASHDQAFIRHAVIAIGTLSNTLGLKLTDGSQGSSHPGSPRIDTNFALHYYSKFLQGSRKALTTGQHGQRMALIVCLLIMCVEGIQWHHGSALKHLTSGMNLLDEWLSSQSLAPMLPGINSPNPDVVEDEIIQQFRMIDLEASVLYDPRPKEYHDRHRKEGNDTINQMPKCFTTSHEARLFLDLVMRRSRHFSRTVRPRKSSPTTLTELDSEMQSLAASFNTFETLEGFIQPLQFEREKYAAENRRWKIAFEPLFASRTPQHRDFLSTRLLKIRSLIADILPAGELSMTEMIYDQHLDSFAEIVQLAKIFCQHPCSAILIPDGSYTANAGLIFPLRLTADKCRSRTIRREAIALLKSKSWREGGLWSSSAARVSEWLMEVEEEDVEGESIPEWARARLLESQFDWGEVRRVRVKCVRGVGETQQVVSATWEWRPAEPWSEVSTPRSEASVGSDSAA